MSATIHDLPDALLGRILGLCGLEAGSSATLVAKHWHAAFYSEPSLWRTLCISKPVQLFASARTHRAYQRHLLWWPNSLRLVQRVGAAVEAAQLERVIGDEPEQLLRQFRPSKLKSLRLSSCWDRDQKPPPAGQELCALTGLTALSLNGDSLPSCFLEAISLMPQLEELAVAGMLLPEQLLSAAALLTQLTALRKVKLPAGSRAPLALRSLSHLRQLELRFEIYSTLAGGGYNVVVPPPVCFPHFHLHSWDVRNFQIQGLEDVSLDAAQLTPASSSGAHSSPAAALRLRRMWRGHSLPRLLDAMLPPSLRLVSLAFTYCDLAPEVACPRLSLLTSLSLNECLADNDIVPLAELARQAPFLRSLTVSEPDFDGVDRVELSVIPHLTHLTSLALPALHLVDSLPPGGYLAGLLELDLSQNDFERVPPVLAAATQLTLLDLRECTYLVLSDSDARLVLDHMPSLARLLLGFRGEEDLGWLPDQKRPVLDLLHSERPGLEVHVSPNFLIDPCQQEEEGDGSDT